MIKDSMDYAAWEPYDADPNFWMKDCKTHYEYIARYVDDLLISSKEHQELLKWLQVVYPLQGVGVPK